MTIEEARRAMALIDQTSSYSTGDKARLEIIAQLLVTTYELGWAHGRLAREAAEERERAAVPMAKAGT